MLQKLKDGANKLKAKIGGDELDEKLVEVTSEENWQASTQQLHEIANAAYNYQKWQKINEFIWEKLKKSKSWKRILKTFNLIDFLLKNGPPSIISNFKYDLYQLRTFESYSNYVDGVDKGEPIRERAKLVVNLLGNEQLLQEERVKAKTIRQKMSNVVGGNSYGAGYGGSYNNNSNYSGHSSSYGSSKTDSEKKNDSYNYGSGLGYFGDYNYNKSTLDKYKDAKGDRPTTSGGSETKKQQKNTAPSVEVETKKPFEKIASKLSKPGEKKEVLIAQPTTVSTSNTQHATTNGKSNIMDIDILGSNAPTTPVEQSTPFSFDNSTPVATTPVSQAQQVQQPYVQPTQAPLQNSIIPQTVSQPALQQQQPFNLYGQPQKPFVSPQQPVYIQPGYGAPHYLNQFPNPQYGGYGQMGQQQNFGYPQNPQQFVGIPNQGYPQQVGYNHNQNPVYPNNPQMPVNQPQKAGNLNVNMGITLSPKKQQQFGAFSSSNAGTAQNVSWLSNTEKGLIDFSDFGNQIKKQDKPAKKQISNNIQIDTTWNW